METILYNLDVLTLIRWCPQTYMDRQAGLGGPGPWLLSVLNFKYS